VAEYFDRVFLINVRPHRRRPVAEAFTAEALARPMAAGWRRPMSTSWRCRIAGLTPFLDALLLQAGYNAALVAIGAGAARLRVRGHGDLPVPAQARAGVRRDGACHPAGRGLAFILMVALGGDGRNLAACCSARPSAPAVGLLLIQWIVARTRLTEDAAIGAVLGVFFGFGIVLLTVIQSMSSGRQAGLEGFLLGSTAGMLRQDAVVIACGRRAGACG
jgi:manganese/zinc/iron transport system permease protein